MDNGWDFDDDLSGGYGNPVQQSSNQQQVENDFGEFDTGNNETSLTQTADGNSRFSVKKTSIIIIAAGVVMLLILLLVIRGMGSNKNKQVNTNNNASEVLSSNQVSVPQNPILSGQSSWMEISDSEDIKFSDTYMPLTFSITEVHHYAKKSSQDGKELKVKTTLVGALSGLTGTYEIDVPYSKGVKVHSGMQISVQVKLGDYNGTRVVEEIIY